jgi:hypothetical protein
MWIILPSLKNLDIIIIFTSYPRRYMDSSKFHGHGMSTFRISLLRRASKLGWSIPHYSTRTFIETSLFVKYMLVVSHLAQ